MSLTIDEKLFNELEKEELDSILWWDALNGDGQFKAQQDYFPNEPVTVATIRRGFESRLELINNSK